MSVIKFCKGWKEKNSENTPKSKKDCSFQWMKIEEIHGQLNYWKKQLNFLNEIEYYILEIQSYINRMNKRDW